MAASPSISNLSSRLLARLSGAAPPPPTALMGDASPSNPSSSEGLELRFEGDLWDGWG